MIADRLGPNQPVYGMRPGNKIMENTNENKQALARYLTREILDVQPEGPFMLGGFCQGAKKGPIYRGQVIGFCGP